MAKLLKAPFAKGHNWWAPIELLQRILFVIFIMILPGNLVSKRVFTQLCKYSFKQIFLQAPVLLFTMVCTAVVAYAKPFRTAYVNALEAFTHVTILLLFIISSTNRFKVCVLVTIISLSLG